MPVATAVADRQIVSSILEQLSNMKYKDRRQRGPDQPVELLEFRPTLIPSILVNKIWADEGTSILWRRYPYLPALQTIKPSRRQYYASKIQHAFYRGPPPESPETIGILDEQLDWSNLKSLELELDYSRHGLNFSSMLHAGLKHFELSGLQDGNSLQFANNVLPALLAPLQRLQSIRFGPYMFSDSDLVHANVLYGPFDSLPAISSIALKASGFADVDGLFSRLSKRKGLSSLEIDLEPGISMLPLFSEPTFTPKPFQDLKRLNIMCYPEIALAMLPHLELLDDLQLDICRVPNHPFEDVDRTIIESLCAQISAVSYIKIGIGALATDFPSSSAFPTLSGTCLVTLAQRCPTLQTLNIFATEPSAIDGSAISSNDFDDFCQNAPQLKALTMKFHSGTAFALEETALQSLGHHCPDLEVLRLKIPFKLPSLPVSGDLPQIMISAPGTPAPEDAASLNTSPHTPMGSASSAYFSFSDFDEESAVESEKPLFPALRHLALSRPENILAVEDDPYNSPSASHPSIIDAGLQENLVRSWANSLITHFPRLEILEAWGDWTGQDNESLNYFLPTEEILASTWEFLSGVEQDLWANGEESDDEGEEEGDSWASYESGDWDAAASLNEFVPDEDTATNNVYVTEPDGYITPGRTSVSDDYLEHDLAPPFDTSTDKSSNTGNEQSGNEKEVDARAT